MKNPAYTPIQKRIDTLTGVSIRCGISRADILTPDGKRASIAEKIGRVVIHRINFPKNLCGKMGRKASLNAKTRPLLTPEEEADTKQSVALALVATGALERERLTLADWRVVFKYVRGADCLRIDRKESNPFETLRLDTLTPEAAAMLAVTKALPTLPLARRNAIARRARYMRTQIFAARDADTSRKAKANFRFARRFLRFVLSHYSAAGADGTSAVTSGNTSASFRVAYQNFRNYCEMGEAALTAESLAGITAKRERELRSFADIPENYAIAA